MNVSSSMTSYDAEMDHMYVKLSPVPHVLSLCVPSFKVQLLAEALHKVEVRLLFRRNDCRLLSQVFFCLLGFSPVLF
jgi:hypothetical protein